MNLIKRVEVPNPPTKYVQKYKKPKVKEGKLITHVDHYLTGNLFASHNLHYSLKRKIYDYGKNILYVHSYPMPKIAKCEIRLTYQHPTDTWDIDNKGYFWMKLFLDILKTPTKRQVFNAHQKGRKIITLDAMVDDTVRFIPKFSCEYIKGEPKLIIEIWGQEQKEVQKTLLI